MKNYPHIKVPPPGPKAKEVIAKDAAFTSTSYIKEYPLVVDRGEGAMLQDVDGNRFLDFMAGIAVVTTGHSHPRVVEAIQRSAENRRSGPSWEIPERKQSRGPSNWHVTIRNVPCSFRFSDLSTVVPWVRSV